MDLIAASRVVEHASSRGKGLTIHLGTGTEIGLSSSEARGASVSNADEALSWSGGAVVVHEIVAMWSTSERWEDE